MTPGEFKAWFDGFTEAFEGRIPTKAQWGRIKDRVAEIDGKPITERVYVDRWWPYYNSLTGIYPLRTYTNCGTSNLTGNASTITLAQSAGHTGIACAFNSSQAMNALGRAEAQSLAA